MRPPIKATPEGVCPVPLEYDSTTLATDLHLLDWFYRARRHGLDRGESYGREAILRWAQTLDPPSDLLLRLVELIRTIVPED